VEVKAELVSFLLIGQKQTRNVLNNLLLDGSYLRGLGCANALFLFLRFFFLFVLDQRLNLAENFLILFVLLFIFERFFDNISQCLDSVL